MATITMGSLDRYPLPRLLCFLHKKRFDGVLRLETRPEPKEIRLEQGVPVSVSGDLHRDLLQLFADRGRIPQEAVPSLAEALSLPYADAEALLGSEAGLSADEVRRGQRFALFQALVGLFGERDAPFCLTAGLDPSAPWATEAVEPLYLVHHGVAAAYDEARLLAELGPVAAQAIQARAGLNDLVARLGFGETEMRPLEYLQRGYWRLDDLLEALPAERLSVLRVVYLLLAAEALDIAPADSVPRLRPKRPEEPPARAVSGSHASIPAPTPLPGSPKRAEGQPVDCVSKAPPLRAQAPGILDAPPPLPSTPPPTPGNGTFAAGPATPPPTPGGGTFAAGRAMPPPTPVSGTFAVGPAMPPPTPGSGTFAAGKAAPPPAPPSATPSTPASGIHASVRPAGSATPSSVENAVRTRSSPTTSGLFARARLAPKVLRDAREISDRVRLDVADKPESVALLDEVLRRLEEMDGQSPFALLGLGLEATVLDVKRAYVTLVKRLHPDRLASLGLSDLGEVADTLFKRLSEAHQALFKEEQLVEARRIYQGSDSREDPEMARLAIEAEVNFQKGEVFFRKGDLAQAEAHFQQAVEGNPEEGEHLALLAWTQYQRIARELRGQHRDRVLKMMTKAVSQSPRCARAHYFLGKLHLEEKRMDSALEAFRTAARLKRSYIEAEREIRLIEMRNHSAKPTASKSSIFDMFKRGKK